MYKEGMTFARAKKISGLRGDELIKDIAEAGYYVRGGKLRIIQDDPELCGQIRRLFKSKERNVRHDMVDGLMDYGRKVLKGVSYIMMTAEDVDDWGLATAWAIPEEKPIENGMANLHLLTWRARPLRENFSVVK